MPLELERIRWQNEKRDGRIEARKICAKYSSGGFSTDFLPIVFIVVDCFRFGSGMEIRGQRQFAMQMLGHPSARRPSGSTESSVHRWAQTFVLQDLEIKEFCGNLSEFRQRSFFVSILMDCWDLVKKILAIHILSIFCSKNSSNGFHE